MTGDDEREAMRRIIAQGSYSRSPQDLPYADVADRLAAAGVGFHRTVRGETTEVECPNCGGDGANYEQVRVGQHATPFVCARCDGEGTVPGVQGEPSDATVAIAELEREIPDAYVDGSGEPVLVLTERSAKTALVALRAAAATESDSDE